MKLVVLSSHTPSLFWFRVDMMKSFIEKGFEVYAVGNESEDEWKQKFSEIGIHYRQIRVFRNGTNPFNDIQTMKSIKKVLSEIRPDKIFSYQAKTVIYGCIAAKQLGITEVYPLIAGLGSVFLSTSLKSKVVRSIMIAEYRVALRNSVNVFFQNHDDSDTFVKYGILEQYKIKYLNGSGVNVDKFIPTPLPQIPTFLNISRLIRDKGIKEYLDACRLVKEKHPEYRCLLVGPFDTNPSALTKEELDVYVNDGTIEYFGEQSDVRPYYNQSSIFVLPSYHEGTPKTVLEAMASGRAVITTDAPGCRETIEHDVNGYLVPVKDTATLAKTMLELAANPMKISMMGAAGRKMAEDKYAVSKVNSDIMSTMKV